MTPVIVGIIALAALLLLLALGMPVSFSLILVGSAGYAFLVNRGAGLAELGTVPFTAIASYTLSVVPLFILMGEFMAHSGTTEDLYRCAHRWVGHFAGGLALATIVACAGFAAVCGSSIATAASIGTVALAEMRRYDYSPGLALGCVAAGGSLGILIPPSLIFIIYGLLTEQSIGKLFLAGVLPGILLALMLMAVIYFLCRRNPEIGPPAPAVDFKQKVNSLKGIWGTLALFLIVMGGIWGGFFTATEAAAIGAFGAFIFALAKRKLNWQQFYNSLIETARKTAMILLIVAGATIFGHFIAVTTVPSALGEFVAGLNMSKYIIFAGMLVVYLILGCLVDGMSMCILTLPIFFPLITKLGFDPLWFGVVVVIMCEVGVLTPPVGLNVFTIAGIARDIPMHTVFRGVVPFWLTMIVCIAVLAVFPQIATFLPTVAK